MVLRGDYAAGYRAARRILAAGEARGYEPGTSQARMISLSSVAGPSRSKTVSIKVSGQGRGLIAGGRPGQRGVQLSMGMYQHAGLHAITGPLLAEAEAALAFVHHTGNEQSAQMLDTYRWLAGVLLGKSTAAAGEAVPADTYAGNPGHYFLLISATRPPPPSSAIRPAWSGTPRPR